MGIRDTMRKRAVQLGVEPPFRNTISPGEQYFGCFKCHHAIPRSRVTEHLKECQPGGVKCGKCKQMVSPEKFLEHITSHQGK